MSGVVHRFGGDWTEEKLDRLSKYLRAYMTIFTANEWARRYSTHYVDAFAGSGTRTSSVATQYSTLRLFDEDEDVQSLQDFYRGSARIALETEPPFNHYLFIEANREYFEELRNLRSAYPARRERISVVLGDANESLQTWCNEVNWRHNRAVVFLDPYGMAVEWQTVEALGRTGGVDLWILFPVGQAINRMLTRDAPPPPAWAERLTAFFGTNAWLDAFYRPRLQASLFEENERLEKQANFESIGAFFAERLGTVFRYVSESSLMMTNSRNVPIFSLYFAASNPTGTKIANDILKG